MDLSDRSTAELVAGSLDDATRLLRAEAELLKVGIVETIMGRLKAAGIVTLAVLAVLPGLMFLVIGATLWLPWSPQADFVVAGAFLIAAAGLGVWLGIRKFKRGDKDGSEALDRVKEDARWVRQRVTS